MNPKVKKTLSKLVQKLLRAIQHSFKALYRTVRHFGWKQWLRLGVFTFFGLLLSGLLFAFIVHMGFFGRLPNEQELRNIKNFNSSEVYTYDRKLLGRYYIENRTNARYENIAPSIIQALVSTEDSRFYQHQGIDYRSMARVFVKSILLGNESSGGGSTISQQLAKNLFPRQDFWILSMPVNKLKEIFIATRLEEIYSKEEILTLYLNTVPFGGNVFGIEAATKRFFNKSAKEIQPEEAAVLVGMLKATTYYSPRLHPERAKGRRNVVLNLMARAGHITPFEADSLKSIPMELDYTYVSHNEGPAPYFREKLRHEVQAWLKEHPKEDGSYYNLYTDGLKIYTTIDSRMQAYAEKAVEEHMKELQSTFFKHWQGRKPWDKQNNYLKRLMQRSARYKQLIASGKTPEEAEALFKEAIPMTVFTWEGEKEKTMSPLDSIAYYQMFLNAGFMAMRPENGHVKAWVGGINHEYFKYDHVSSRRQVGSTFKPIVYAAAIEDGRDPCDFISNELRTYEEYDDWTPRNSDNKYEGYYSMPGALAHSVNTVTVDLMMETGVRKVSALAHDMGIENELPVQPSIALGTADLTLSEMLTVYGTFVNRGYKVKPVYLLGIEDQYGNVVADFTKEKADVKRVLREETADMMIHMLKNVIDSGTARRLRYRYGLRNEIAGKTGTTQSQADGWFIGATPKLVAGSWVGGPSRLIRFRNLTLGQGANTALPIWAKFMQQVNREPEFRMVSNGHFAQPKRRTMDKLDCEFYKDELDEDKGFFWRLFAGDKDRREREDRSAERVQRVPQQSKEKQRERTKFGDIIRGIFGGRKD
ncbi:transglycosylase domain-containing protein [Porifericola rhodea]|uniref:transglycosylase domain-containing protein n=1 Tax=Porifericola rhodea TaxID=930972 RepID=UPI002666EB95|nr:transglycosylase domain-containing protein [Porifericola rhodea]WKN32177.1 transglycosylase domain-containing protein [Porifericola rhodea]